MTLEDDDPAHFEIVLKFAYTATLDMDAISRLAASAPREIVKHLIGVSIVADKYDISRILPPITEQLEIALSTLKNAQFSFYKDMVETYYGSCLLADTAIGQRITQATVKYRISLVSYTDFEELVKRFPIFAVDIALDQHKQGILGATKKKCQKCQGTSTITKAGYTHCVDCGRAADMVTV